MNVAFLFLSRLVRRLPHYRRVDAIHFVSLNIRYISQLGEIIDLRFSFD